MKYTLSWQDFMRQPVNKALKESKGIHACKQKYIQEQNKLMWHDPVMITENAAAGQSVTNNNSAAGGSTAAITGHTAEVATWTWSDNIHAGDIGNDWTGSLNFGITHYAIKNNSLDLSFGHSDSRYKILLAFVTGSNMGNLDGTGLSTTGYDFVITASLDALGGLLQTPSGSTGSAGDLLSDNVAGLAAGATVAGFTNPAVLTPAALFSVATASGGGASFTITNAVKGSVTDAAFDGGAATGSISVTTNGNDTFFADPAGQVFDGQTAPYSSHPRQY